MAWLALSLAIDPGWFLAAFILTLLVFRGALEGRIPLYTSNKATALALGKFIDDQHGVRFIDLRASLLPTDKVVEQAAFDKYTYIRDAYLQNRISEINDGNVPIESRDDAECKLSRCY